MKRFSKYIPYSILIHLAVFFVLYIMREENPPRVVHQVQLIDTEKRIDKKKVEEIKKKIEKVNQEAAQQAKNTKETSKDAQEKSQGDEKEPDFEDSFEKTLFSRKETTDYTKTGESKGNTAWSEKEHKGGNSNDKSQVQETVNVPDGKTTTGDVRWRGGYSRNMLYSPQPEYPLQYRKEGIQAVVLLQVEVDATGKVVSVEVLNSSGYPKLDINAKNSIRRARFSPASAGDPNAYGEVAVKFELGKR